MPVFRFVEALEQGIGRLSPRFTAPQCGMPMETPNRAPWTSQHWSDGELAPLKQLRQVYYGHWAFASRHIQITQKTRDWDSVTSARDQTGCVTLLKTSLYGRSRYSPRSGERWMWTTDWTAITTS